MGKITFTPSSGFILLKTVDKDTSNTTIDIAEDTNKMPASKGVVIAVGETKLHESGSLIEAKAKVGDLVLFKPFGADIVQLNNEDYRIVPFENIRGTFNEK